MIWNERRSAAIVIVFGSILFVPHLGTLGLWDPWETHYGEVARSMIARGDYVYPYWSTAYFFSKPILTLWLMAVGMLLTGSEPGIAGAPLGPWVEWGVRLPFAILAILALWAVYRIGRELKDSTTGLIATFVLGTSPQFIFIGKQAITDLPMLSLTFAGLAFFLPPVFRAEPQEASRSLRIGSVTLFTLVTSAQLILIGATAGSWWPLFPAAGVLIIGGLLFTAKNAALHQITIAAVFFGLAALAKGLEVGVLIAPVFLGTLLMTRDWAMLRRARPLFALLVFALVAVPWYVTLCLFTGRDEEGLTFMARFFGHDHFARVASGVHGDRGGAGYFGEQLLYGFFPWSALLPLALFSIAKEIERSAKRGPLIFVLLFGLWVYAFFTASSTKLHHYVFPAIPALALVVAVAAREALEVPRRKLAGGLILMALLIYAVALRDLLVDPRNLVNLFTYKYDREYPREIMVRPFLVIFAGGGGLAAFYAVARDKTTTAMAAFGSTALVLALWLSHHHFNMLSPHWSQAHLFQTYFEERKAGEPLLAYQLNWRGETFYSRNEVVQVMGNGASQRLKQALERPGREFIILESSRYHELRGALPQQSECEILDRSNTHFYLCVVDR